MPLNFCFFLLEFGGSLKYCPKYIDISTQKRVNNLICRRLSGPFSYLYIKFMLSIRTDRPEHIQCRHFTIAGSPCKTHEVLVEPVVSGLLMYSITSMTRTPMARLSPLEILLIAQENDYSGIFYGIACFVMKTDVVRTHKNRIIETIPMRILNIPLFYRTSKRHP